MRVVLTALVVSAFAMTAQAQEAIAFKELAIPAAQSGRSLDVGIWYPSSAVGPLTPVGENAVFYGVQSVTNAAPNGGARPLVLLSHGYGGTWRNLSWIAQALVAQGYVVAAPNHPGTTAFDRDSVAAARLWERPQDLSRVIDDLIGDETIAGEIDSTRIAAIGHSLGGWTVAALGGARSDIGRYRSDCATNGELRACALLDELGIVAGNEIPLEAELSDPRVGAIVSIDLGLARGFTPESLSAFAVPALVFGAGVDIGGIPARLESGWLVAGLPAATTQYVEIPDAMHFTFMQVCKPGAVEILKEEEPGEEFVCQDPGPRDRSDIHQEVTDRILVFLADAIPAR